MARIGRGEPVEPESYYDYALTLWLPRRWDSDPRYARGLEALAGLSEERHHDRWLRDVMAVARSERLQRGHAALGEAVAANLRDDSGSAMEFARQASAHMQAAGDRAGALRAETELVYGLHRSFDPRDCVDRALAVIPRAAAGGYRWILGQTQIELGICRGILGDAGGAHRDMSAALKTAQEARYESLQLRADGVLTAELALSGNVVAAWEHSMDGLRRFWRGAHRANRAQQYYDLLRGVARQSDHPLAALAFARSNAEAISETALRSTEGIARALVAGLAAENGLRDEAAKESEAAIRILSELRDSKAANEHRLYAEIALARADPDPARALRRLEGLRKTVDQSSSLLTELRFLQATGDTHWKAGDWTAAGTAWETAIGRYERQLISLREFDQRLDHLRAAREAYRGSVAVKWAGGRGAEAALERWEWFRSGELRRSRTQQPLPLATLRRETILAYSVLPDGIAAWAFDDRGVKGVRLDVTTDQMRLEASRFARLCADPQSSLEAVETAGRRLYDWLVAPFEDRLTPDRLLVVEPDGPISAAPFPALVDRRGMPLGARFDVVVASSVWDYLARAAKPGVNDRTGALIVANPELSGEMRRAFPPLAGALREGQAVAERFPRAVLLEGSQATLEAVARRRPQAELFHFAGHGFSHSGNGGLLLAGPAPDRDDAGVLDGKSLAGQDWSRCRLAVLSACSAGMGEASGPVNPESLVRRLLWAGVPRVVASRWRVDSETAIELMSALYDGLLAGLETPAALRRAGLRISERGGQRHPYYWAGFQTFGAR